MQSLTFRNSLVQAYMNCPRLAEYQYILKIPGRVSYNLFLGGAYHKAVGDNLAHKMKTAKLLPLSDVEDIFSTSWEKKDKIDDEESRHLEIDFGDEDPGIIKDEGIQLVRAQYDQRAKKIKPIAVEENFELVIPDTGVAFTGRIDVREEHEAIIDHKTSKRSKTVSDVESSLQPYSYSMSRFLNAGVTAPVKFSFHTAVRKRKPEVQEMTVVRTIEHVNWYINEVLKPVIGLIKTGLFPPRPNIFTCPGCQFAGLCRPWMQK